jgi:hypothetical protein
VADLSRFSFAGSEPGEQEFALRFSAEILSDVFMMIHDLWPNTALEPTRITPSVCREVAGWRMSQFPRGSALDR